MEKLKIQNKEKLLEMVEYYGGVVNLLPDEIDGYMNRGFNYYLLMDFKNAFTDFSKVVEIDPKNMIARCLMAFSRDRNNDHEKAVEDFQEILKIDPKFSDAYVGIGLMKLRKGKKSEGLKFLNKAVAVDPKNERACIYRGEVHFREKHYEDAIRDFEKVVSINPTLKKKVSTYLGKAHFKVGISHADKGNYERAIKHFTKSLSANPVNINGYLFRGEAYMNIENFSRAKKDLKKAQALDPHGSTGKTAAELLSIIKSIK